MEPIVRYKGKWYKIHPKQYESERQTYQIAWKMIKENIDSKQAYIEWFNKEREESKLLYPLFVKND
jgi:hypothetical protein